MFERMALLALALMLGCGDGGSTSPDAATGGVGVLFINEVMPSNTGASADPFGEFDDWVELYNASASDIDLGGYSLTDDLAMPAKAPLAAGLVVPARGYLVIWCDGQVQGIDHVPLKLDAGGEEIALFSPEGESVDSLAFGMATTDVSFARVPDGTGEFVSCTTSTIAGANGCTGAR